MAEPFNYGGQAIIEGVMMRGSRRLAMAARNPQGEIIMRIEPLNAALYNGPVSKLPLLRGLISLWDSLGLGMRALMWSADIALEEEEESAPAFEGILGWLTGLVGFGHGRSRVMSSFLPP